jgi:hypothetical protein
VLTKTGSRFLRGGSVLSRLVTCPSGSAFHEGSLGKWNVLARVRRCTTRVFQHGTSIVFWPSRKCSSSSLIAAHQHTLRFLLQKGRASWKRGAGAGPGQRHTVNNMAAHLSQRFFPQQLDASKATPSHARTSQGRVV